jgi:transcriptional accessory protein Tex/SPT6
VPDDAVKGALNDLLGYLEHLETRTGIVIQFLKENGVMTDEKLDPYLEQASSP